ncbi:NAD(P)H azoreductase [Halioglobus japonicus]|nr:NAD(P)H azoreductase [Halioglobus japonicus]
MKKVLIAGATGYLGKYAVKAFKERGYWVRVLTRDKKRLFESGPFNAPPLSTEDFDDLFIGEVSDPATLIGVMEGIDIVYSSVGISRQRDGLTFDQVDYQCNCNLIDLCLAAGVPRFVYVSMQGAENIMHLAITQAHERVVADLKQSGLEYRIIRPCGYFSDMGVLYDMARKGRSFLIGQGNNRMNPIHGRDLAEACVDAAEGETLEVEAGGPDIMTQREAAELAFEVAGNPVKITVIPMWLARGLARFIGLLSTQFGDLADFIVTAGELDGVGPKRGKTSLKSYFETLHSAAEKQK